MRLIRQNLTFTNLSRYMVIASGVFFLVGCQAGVRQAGPSLVPMEEAVVPTPAPRKTNEGSIFQGESQFSSLFSNPRAAKTGDIVTIKIVESSSASNQAATNTGRDSSLTGQINTFFNLENKYASTGSNFNPFGKVSGGLQNSFAGTGATTRSGDLSAYITAKVVDVLPNGNLGIMGTREVQVNHETQYIAVSGVVRPRDISPENIILSTYISDAKITYSGDGIVNQKQQAGWMTRILDKAWPF